MRPTLTPLNGLFHVCLAQIDVADCRDCSNNPNIRMPDSYCCSSVTKKSRCCCLRNEKNYQSSTDVKKTIFKGFSDFWKKWIFWIWMRYFVSMKRVFRDSKITDFSRNLLSFWIYPPGAHSCSSNLCFRLSAWV